MGSPVHLLAAPGSAWLHLVGPACLPDWPANASLAASGPGHLPQSSLGLSGLHSSCSWTIYWHRQWNSEPSLTTSIQKLRVCKKIYEPFTWKVKLELAPQSPTNSSRHSCTPTANTWTLRQQPSTLREKLTYSELGSYHSCTKRLLRCRPCTCTV